MGKEYKVTAGKIPRALTLEFSGLKEANAQLETLRKIGKKLKKTAQNGILTSPKTGNYYTHRKVGRTRASQAGAYPANQSGDLKRSVRYRVPHRMLLKFGSDIEYGKYLQTTNDPDKPAGGLNRPFLTKAHNAVKKDFKRMMTNDMLKELK